MPNVSQATENTNPMRNSMSMPVVDSIPEIPTGMNISEGLPEDFPIGE